MQINELERTPMTSSADRLRDEDVVEAHESASGTGARRHRPAFSAVLKAEDEPDWRPRYCCTGDRYGGHRAGRLLGSDRVKDRLI